MPSDEFKFFSLGDQIQKLDVPDLLAAYKEAARVRDKVVSTLRDRQRLPAAAKEETLEACAALMVIEGMRGNQEGARAYAEIGLANLRCPSNEGS